MSAPDHIVRAIAALFESRTGHQLGESRLWRVETALREVLKNHGMKDLAQLLAILHAEPNSVASSDTIHALMNHESSFFRDIGVFDQLESEILPHFNHTLSKRHLRIWCSGCSTGQEAYSLAIILKRQEALWRDWRVSILATDVSPAAISKAQIGLYEQMDVQRGLPIGDLLRWFEPINDRWRISADLQAMITFRVDNILEPIVAKDKFDLVLCRNVLLYFPAERRAEALDQLSLRTASHGILALGAGETTIGATGRFVPSSQFRGVYRTATQQAPATLAGNRRLAG